MAPYQSINLIKSMINQLGFKSHNRDNRYTILTSARLKE